jgi:hypothetical protein
MEAILDGTVFQLCPPRGPVFREPPAPVIRELANEALRALSPQFEMLYSEHGRPSIHPSNCCVSCYCQELGPFHHGTSAITVAIVPLIAPIKVFRQCLRRPPRNVIHA